MTRSLVAIEPKSFREYEEAVRQAGAEVAPMSSSIEALIWTDYSAPDLLAQMLAENPQIKWVQLPFAGVDAFAETISAAANQKLAPLITSAKGCYREPVAEHALALTLALCRAIPERVRATTWGRKFAVSLYESRVLIFGGGGITEELLLLLAPFKTEITVVRKRVNQSVDGANMQGATRTLPFEQLDSALADADVVILAAALTAETTNLFNAERLALMKSTSYLINIARGPMIVSADLEAALKNGVIAGAAIDVTDPEPLPEGHPLWTTPNLIITPHTADTRDMVVRLFSKRIRENVQAYFDGGDMVGVVDPQLGY